MRLLRASDHRRMPWKNGAGVTTEIAVSPEGVGLDDFDWRVSMARVERDGPFSMFAGIDRTLAVLEGDGIILDVEGHIPLGLTRRFNPVTFPGDAATSCRLIGGPITDLNVMSRRASVEHSMAPLALDGDFEMEVVEPDTLLMCLDGTVSFVCAAGSGRLDLHDCLVWGDAAGALGLSHDGAATVAVIEFRYF